MVKREDLQKEQGWKQENQVGRRLKKQGRGSFGVEEKYLHCSLGVYFSLSFSLSLSLSPWVIFFVPSCYYQNCKDFPYVFGLLNNREK